MRAGRRVKLWQATGARPSGRRNVRSQPTLPITQTRTNAHPLVNQNELVWKLARPIQGTCLGGLTRLCDNVAADVRRTRASRRRSLGQTYSAGGGEVRRPRTARCRRAHGNGAGEYLATEWRQRNEEVETFCLHSFASIPLPIPAFEDRAPTASLHLGAWSFP